MEIKKEKLRNTEFQVISDRTDKVLTNKKKNKTGTHKPTPQIPHKNIEEKTGYKSLIK